MTSAIIAPKEVRQTVSILVEGVKRDWGMIYAFGNYELDLQCYKLRHRGVPCKLERQEFNTLAYLIEHRDRVATKGELLEQVWPDQFVSDATLSHRVMTTRKTLRIPAASQDLLTTRLDMVGDTKRTAQLGATVGREFSDELLRAVSPLAEDELRADLNTLIAADLLYQRGLGGRAMYQFKHALIQEAAYSSLLRRTRQQQRLVIAQTLESHFPKRTAFEPELLAHHYMSAGRYDLAVQYWNQAGQQAARHSANREAVACFEQALLALRQVPKSRAQIEQELALQFHLAGGIRCFAVPVTIQTKPTSNFASSVESRSTGFVQLAIN